MKTPLLRLLGLICLGLTSGAALAAAPPTPLPQAFSHNDEAHPRPLLDALDHGFCNIEADVWLVDGQLFAAHDRRAVKPDRTLKALYLDPLAERIRENGGRLYPHGPPGLLMIDVKSDARETYRVLRDLLGSYTNILTEFTPTRTITNALTVILSGNRATEMLATEPRRYAAIDGRLPDLNTDASPHLIPLVSDNWTLHFRWRGQVPLPEAERQKLQQLVERAHQQGRRIRFWAAPDNPAGWQELSQCGVDLINTDHLSGLKDWLQKK